MNAFAIFGNPIKHSKSAEIYAFFAREAGILEKYDLNLVLRQEDFDSILFNFFKSGGIGANITVPFKEHAFLLCDQLTNRSKIARAVNTIKKELNGALLGDNTDGIGFINDLKYLNWIYDNNHYFVVTNEKLLEKANILLIGAGGAAKGIIPELLTIKKCHLNVVNRTCARAQILVQSYCSMGYQNISYMSLYQLSYDHMKYDLIINATTSSMLNDVLEIPSSLITPETKCYDLFYQKKDTSFLMWCKKNGAEHCADGLGMLIEQAAHSFYLWHNFIPSTACLRFYLRSIL